MTVPQEEGYRISTTQIAIHPFMQTYYCTPVPSFSQQATGSKQPSFLFSYHSAPTRQARPYSSHPLHPHVRFPKAE